MDVKSVVLEENQRFSNSILWNLQDEAYKQFGIEAWSQQGVPFYLTSNPHTAHSYAHIALGYIRDLLRNRELNTDEPLYVFDLGAGSGRFAFLFLKTLLPLLERLFEGKVRLCYVLTDIVEQNVTFWQKHPLLRQWWEEGILECAYYAHDQTKPLKLLKSGIVLEEVRNPCILVANYFFDTIPQDLFRVHEGKLEEGRVTITVENLAGSAGPAEIPKLHCRYSYVPIAEPMHYYPRLPELNNLLALYKKTFDNTPFLFPEGAFRSIRFFAELSRNRLLLLSGDQGVATEEQIKRWGEPHIARHGTFSIAVSYHALAHYFRQAGGLGLLTSFSDPFFVVAACVFGKQNYPETVLAFEEHHDHFEPKDYWHLVDKIQEGIKEPSFDYLVMLLKLGYWDPVNFHFFYQGIHDRVRGLPKEKRQELVRVLDLVRGQFFPICVEEGEFLMNLGVLYYQLEHPQKALELFRLAEALGYQSPQLSRNIAACTPSLS